MKSLVSNLALMVLVLALFSSCSRSSNNSGSLAENATHSIASTVANAVDSLQPCVEPDTKIPIKHVFLIVLENKSYDRTFGTGSTLRTLATQGVLHTNYWGIGHNSLDNYIAMISGQAPNPVTQMDCPVFVDLQAPGEVKRQFARNFAKWKQMAEGHVHSLTRSDDAEKQTMEKTFLLVDSERSKLPEEVNPEYQLQPGAGCIYPDYVHTIADQLEEKTPGHGWRAYMEGMGRSCEHPEPRETDKTSLPFLRNPQYYTPRHNPFVYFRSLIGNGHHPHGSCSQYDRPLGDLSGTSDGLAKDLKNDDIPSFVFISPNLCHDGHSDCSHPNEKDPSKKRVDEMSSIDEFVPKLVAIIKSSDAYKDGGMIVVTFDEAEVPKTAQTIQFLPEDEEHDEDPNPAPDWANSCCNEKPGPGWKDPGLRGPGGGRVGAIVISPFIRERSPDDKHAFNHYSLLRTFEDLFDLHKPGATSVEHLGYAGQSGLNTFQACNVFNQVPQGSQSAAFTE